MPFLFALTLAASPVFQPRVVDDGKYSESNTMIAWLSDGTYVQAQVIVSRIPTSRAGCSVLMVRPGSPPWVADKVVDWDAWTATTKPVPTLTAGPCKATASGSMTTMDLQLEGGSISMALAAGARATPAPGFAPLTFGDAFYEQEVLVPFAPVEVVWEPSKGEPQVLKGYGYADHSRSTCYPKTLMHGWLRFRGFSEKCSTVVSVRLPPDKKDAPSGYWWRQGTKAPETLQTLAVKLPPEKAQPVPFDVTVTSAQRPFNLRATQLLYRNAPLETHGFLGRMAKPFLGNPVTYTYGATLHDPTCGDITGVMELEWADD